MVQNPSLANAGYLLWDVGAAVLPFVPGSYVSKGTKAIAKGAKTVRNAKIAARITLKVASNASDFRHGKFIIGSYRSLKRTMRYKKGIEVHHIIEKRFRVGKNVKLKNANMWLAVPMDKGLHRMITNRFYQAYKYNTAKSGSYYDISKETMKKIVCQVYYDMPQLKKIALDHVNQIYK